MCVILRMIVFNCFEKIYIYIFAVFYNQNYVYYSNNDRVQLFFICSVL